MNTQLGAINRFITCPKIRASPKKVVEKATTQHPISVRFDIRLQYAGLPNRPYIRTAFTCGNDTRFHVEIWKVSKLPPNIETNYLRFAVRLDKQERCWLANPLLGPRVAVRTRPPPKGKQTVFILKTQAQSL